MAVHSSGLDGASTGEDRLDRQANEVGGGWAPAMRAADPKLRLTSVGIVDDRLAMRA